jgi:serine/threonine protein kinase
MDHDTNAQKGNAGESLPEGPEAVFEVAVQLARDQREAYLDQACAGNPALRQRVAVLLKRHEQAEGFLEPVVASNKTIVLSIPTEKPGDKIGRYKLLQQIGEGGCGVVYMAEQEEPVRRRVALKVVKLGMDTKSVIARFEAERQALALMDHPNIAQVYDAGATDNGRPFFVMELVRGIKITDYCDQNKLSAEQRLKLFVQVCFAIQHAHQKGIIHRDIKPSNILVTLHDGLPVPKVIDFGIAKATQGRLTDHTLFTAFEQFIGTPAYMSPEQAEMSGLDIDTRCDIYALGVLLYELLTGQTPFDARELIDSGLDQMRRTIREKEPDKPSTRVSTMVNDDLTAAAMRRGTDAPRLIHLLRGDLDWIVMKCLEKDRTRRFETANGLALDIQRHLNNEPVTARPPSKLYRFEKLVRRNKAAFAAIAGGLVALIGGLGLSLYLLIKERDAHRRALAAEQEQILLRMEAEEHAEWSAKIARAGMHLTRSEFDEAERLVSEVPAYPAFSAFYNVFGGIHARRGLWNAALTNFSKVVEFMPSDHQASLRLAPLLLQTANIEGYQHHREGMIQKFASTTDPVVAERMAKACLLVPANAAELAAISRMVETSVAAGPDHKFWAYFQFVKGLVEYRQGHFANAREWLEKAFAQKSDRYRTAQACLVLAMTLHALNKNDEARSTFAQATEMVETQLPNLQKGILDEQWFDWLIVRLLYEEARAQIPLRGASDDEAR